MFKNKEYVLTVYKEGSFTKASEKLFVSQPSLSASIKRIETKVGGPIFDRSATPVSLTEVGREYVKYAMEIQDREEDFKRYMSDHASFMVGNIKIGGSSFFSSFILPKMISNFNEQYEKISFEITEGNTKTLLDKLYTGELDLVIDNAIIHDENILSKAYINERLILAVPKKFKINESLSHVRMTAEDIKADKHLKGTGVSFSVLKKEPFILLHAENDTGKRAEKLFKKYDVTPNIVFRLDQQITAYNISCSGIGISFVCDTLVKNIAASPDVFYYKISDNLAIRNIYLYEKKKRYQSLACRKFVDFATKE